MRSAWSFLIIICFGAIIWACIKGNFSDIRYFTILIMLLNIRLKMEDQ